MFTKRNTLVSLALAFIMIICSGCFNHNATQPASLFNPSTWGDTVPIITTAVATRPVGDFTLEPNTLGAPPATNENVDPKIYVQPYTAGTITDTQGNGVWTQSGIDGSANLLGAISEGSFLEIDSLTMEKGGVGLTGGNLIVVAGPIPDLGKLAISYSNGGANWVKGDLQAFLDDNIYGKFCRGNLVVDPTTKKPILDSKGDLQFAYSPWALRNIQLPAGYKMKSLSTCPKNRGQDQTTYPTL